MRWILAATLWIGASACGVAPQPESAKTVAAFEVPLPSQADRKEFLCILRNVAEAEGMHVDATSNEELERQAGVSPAFKMTMNATVWKGTRDDEPIASAMDGPDHLGHVWISFFKGEDPALNSRFREHAMREIMRNWPEALSLPIMPTGAIPHPRDLIRMPEGYVVNPNEAQKYELHSRDGTTAQ
jgi:hypothetical protein